MFLTGLFTIVASISFQGGSDANLVRFLSQQFSKPVALLYDPERQWSSCRYVKPNSIGDELHVLSSRLGTVRLSGDTLEIAAAGFPRQFYVVERRPQYQAFGGGRLPNWSHNLISCETGAKPIALTEAFPPESGMRISWHWFFDGARLLVDAKNIAASDYVQLIARSIGARVIRKSSGYYFDFDPQQYRDKARVMCRMLLERKLEDVLKVEDYRYWDAVLSYLSDGQISTGMAASNKVTFFPEVISGEVQTAAIARLRRLFGGVNGPTHPSTSQAWNDIRSNVDLDHLQIAFYAGGVMRSYAPAARPGAHAAVF